MFDEWRPSLYHIDLSLVWLSRCCKHQKGQGSCVAQITLGVECRPSSLPGNRPLFRQLSLTPGSVILRGSSHCRVLLVLLHFDSIHPPFALPLDKWL